MKYDICQETIYRYGSPVTQARHTLRLTPIDRVGQQVILSMLEVEPAPLERREGHDFFGNRVTSVVIEKPHDMLSVRVVARVNVNSARCCDVTPEWGAVRGEAFQSSDFSPMAPAHYIFPSRIVSLDPEIRDYAAISFGPEVSILDGAVDFMHRIKSEFVYEPGATTATTTPPMSFALRRGVCQDFSHIMISGMRALGLPVSYVSGYLRTSQPGAVRLQGADAMHAWVMVWCGPEVGWIGLDPTNDMLAGDDHVVLAVGRDYADVAPIDGIIFGGSGQQLEVSVRVTPL